MNYDNWRHAARGWLFHFIGKKDLAYGEYATAYRHRPSPSAARNLGVLAAGRDEFAESARWFEAALRLQPDDPDTLFNLGYVQERHGDRRQAIEAFRRAVALKPVLDRAWYGMGLAHAALGEHGDAATALEEAARLQPMNGEAWYHLGMAQHHAGNRERVREVAEHLKGFDPRRSNQLIRDAGRDDLADLVQELPF